MRKPLETLKRSTVAVAVAIAIVAGLGGVAYAGARGAADASANRATTVVVGDDTYMEQGGVVYEYDDGQWEPEYDKKIEGGRVYEWENGRWEPEGPSPAQADASPDATPAAGSDAIVVGDDTYYEDGGVIFEYDDGRWEPEYDMRIDGGTIYEYEDGRWEVERDDDSDDAYDWDDADDWDDDLVEADD